MKNDLIGGAPVETVPPNSELPTVEPDAPVNEIKNYADGSSATGPGPLPDVSPEGAPVVVAIDNAAPSGTVPPANGNISTSSTQLADVLGAGLSGGLGSLAGLSGGVQVQQGIIMSAAVQVPADPEEEPDTVKVETNPAPRETQPVMSDTKEAVLAYVEAREKVWGAQIDANQIAIEELQKVEALYATEKLAHDVTKAELNEALQKLKDAATMGFKFAGIHRGA